MDKYKIDILKVIEQPSLKFKRLSRIILEKFNNFRTEFEGHITTIPSVKNVYEISILDSVKKLEDGTYISLDHDALLPTFKMYLETNLEIVRVINKTYLAYLEPTSHSLISSSFSQKINVGDQINIAGTLSDLEKSLFRSIREKLNVINLPSLANVIFDSLKKRIEDFKNFKRIPYSFSFMVSFYITTEDMTILLRYKYLKILI